MATKDGSFSFVLRYQQITYTLDDDRKVSIYFTEENSAVKVVETFKAEMENTIELQQLGWQAILNNFKVYVETN